MGFSAFFGHRGGGLIIIYARRENVNRCTKKPAKHQKFCADRRARRGSREPTTPGSIFWRKKRRIPVFTVSANEKFVLPSEWERKRKREHSIFVACIICMHTRVIGFLQSNKKLSICWNSAKVTTSIWIFMIYVPYIITSQLFDIYRRISETTRFFR